MTKQIVTLPGGFIQLNDVMPGENADMAVINAARVSFAGKSKSETNDKQLLRYLFENRHTTPFEQVQFKFTVQCPIFVARQWMRHRTWSYNELSRRYSGESPTFYRPRAWRKPDDNNLQSSENMTNREKKLVESYVADILYGGEVIPTLDSYLEQYQNRGLKTYNAFIQAGVCREQARMFLPVNMYTKFIASVNAHNLMHFLRLRLDEHAQYEIRVYAEAMLIFLEETMPWTAELFKGRLLRDSQ